MTCRKHVAWDERNLEDNEEYRRLHPVTMKITEPKTPYEYGSFDEEGGFEEPEAMVEARAAEEESSNTWDPKVNASTREMKKAIAKEVTVKVAPVSSSGRPMLLAGTTNGDILEKKHEQEFKRLRKAVYAEEGAKFKALSANKDDDDDDDDDDDK